MDVLFEQVFRVVPIQYLTFIMSVATIAVLFYGIRPVLKDLTAQVKKTNGSVISLNQWKDDHNDSDDQRHRENLGRLAEINASLREMHRK